MATRTLHIRPPVGGVHKRTDFQAQAPFTCYDALDWYSVDDLTGRDRIATRRGFASFTTPGGLSTDPVNGQTTLDLANDEPSGRMPIVTGNGSIYGWNGASWDALGGSAVDESRTVQLVSIFKKVYILNKTLDYKVYDYDTDLVTTWAPTDVPVNNIIGCEWDQRLVLCGDEDSPHVISMSRQDDPDDWAFAEPIEDRSAAFQDALNFAVRAIVPHENQCLLVGGISNWEVYRGNPRYGGRRARLSYVNGPICQTGWCKTPDGWVYYMSRDGIYRIPPGCGDTPQPVSRDIIPDELIGLDGVSDICYMAYCPRFRRIYISVVGGSSEGGYWLNPTTHAFWPITQPEGVTIQSLYHHPTLETAEKSGVMYGVSGGLKRYDTTAAFEGVAAPTIKIGPIRLADLGRAAHIVEAVCKLGNNSSAGTSTVKIYTASDGEAVVALPTDRFFSATVAQTINNMGRIYPDLKGQAMMLVLSVNTTTDFMSFEEMDLFLVQSGIEG
jgi:hypothetical protein